MDFKSIFKKDKGDETAERNFSFPVSFLDFINISKRSPHKQFCFGSNKSSPVKLLNRSRRKEVSKSEGDLDDEDFLPTYTNLFERIKRTGSDDNLFKCTPGNPTKRSCKSLSSGRPNTNHTSELENEKLSRTDTLNHDSVIKCPPICPEANRSEKNSLIDKYENVFNKSFESGPYKKSVAAKPSSSISLSPFTSQDTAHSFEVVTPVQESAYYSWVASPVQDSAHSSRVASPVQDSAHSSRAASPVQDSAHSSRVASPVHDSTHSSRVASPVQDSAHSSRVASPVQYSAHSSRISSPVQDSAHSSRVASPVQESAVLCVATTVQDTEAAVTVKNLTNNVFTAHVKDEREKECLLRVGKNESPSPDECNGSVSDGDLEPELNSEWHPKEIRRIFYKAMVYQKTGRVPEDCDDGETTESYSSCDEHDPSATNLNPCLCRFYNKRNHENKQKHPTIKGPCNVGKGNLSKKRKWKMSSCACKGLPCKKASKIFQVGNDGKKDMPNSLVKKYQNENTSCAENSSSDLSCVRKYLDELGAKSKLLNKLEISEKKFEQFNSSSGSELYSIASLSKDADVLCLSDENSSGVKREKRERRLRKRVSSQSLKYEPSLVIDLTCPSEFPESVTKVKSNKENQWQKQSYGSSNRVKGVVYISESSSDESDFAVQNGELLNNLMCKDRHQFVNIKSDEATNDVVHLPSTPSSEVFKSVNSSEQLSSYHHQKPRRILAEEASTSFDPNLEHSSVFPKELDLEQSGSHSYSDMHTDECVPSISRCEGLTLKTDYQAKTSDMCQTDTFLHKSVSHFSPSLEADVQCNIENSINDVKYSSTSSVSDTENYYVCQLRSLLDFDDSDDGRISPLLPSMESMDDSYCIETIKSTEEVPLAVEDQLPSTSYVPTQRVLRTRTKPRITQQLMSKKVSKKTDSKSTFSKKSYNAKLLDDLPVGKFVAKPDKNSCHQPLRVVNNLINSKVLAPTHTAGSTVKSAVDVPKKAPSENQCTTKSRGRPRKDSCLKQLNTVGNKINDNVDVMACAADMIVPTCKDQCSGKGRGRPRKRPSRNQQVTIDTNFDKKAVVPTCTVTASGDVPKKARLVMNMEGSLSRSIIQSENGSSSCSKKSNTHEAMKQTQTSSGHVGQLTQVRPPKLQAMQEEANARIKQLEGQKSTELQLKEADNQDSAKQRESQALLNRRVAEEKLYSDQLVSLKLKLEANKLAKERERAQKIEQEKLALEVQLMRMTAAAQRASQLQHEVTKAKEREREALKIAKVANEKLNQERKLQLKIEMLAQEKAKLEAEKARNAKRKTQEQRWECPVCFEPRSPSTQLAVTPCGHVFCKNCILKVAQATGTCPICNQGFTEAQVTPLFFNISF